MATTYYTRVHIEGIWTKYQVNKDQDIERSKGGHMWYETYQKDENGNITNQLSSGYTSHGVVNNDKDAYIGDSAYSSKEIVITKEQFDKLQVFGQNSTSSQENGFGNGAIWNGGDYDPITNSCVDYTFKAMEIAGINSDKFQGDVIPMNTMNKGDRHHFFIPFLILVST
jgi:hypothetical protein